MGYTLNVEIKGEDYPELGTPVVPKDYDSVQDILPKESKTKLRDKYEAINRGLMGISADMSSTSGTALYSLTYSADALRCGFIYEEGSPKTYKFMGMDIDEDYDAIIQMGDGYIKVAHMFDPVAVAGKESGDGRFSPTAMDEANKFILGSTSEIARFVTTSMKTGFIYNLYRGGRPRDNGLLDVVRSITLSDCDPLIQNIASKFTGSSSSESSGFRFKSVLLNLVDRSKRQEMDISAQDNGNADMGTTVACIVLSKLMAYWEDVMSDYSVCSTAVSAIDLWSDLGKSVLGDKAFNEKMQKSMALLDDTTGELYKDRMVSFNGVVRNDGVTDMNLIRSEAVKGLRAIGAAVSGSTYSGSREMEFKDVMVSMVDTDSFEDVYSLSLEELQAVSSYDSLRYVDDDAKSCMESYDMNDPEDRSLFIKSAIKSYDRNFRTFKAKDDYDVNQAFSDMVEQGVTFGMKIESRADAADDGLLATTTVTSSEKEIRRKESKKALIKVGRLLNKSLSNVFEVLNAQASVKP